MDFEFPALHLNPRLPRAGRNNVVSAARSAGCPAGLPALSRGVRRVMAEF